MVLWSQQTIHPHREQIFLTGAKKIRTHVNEVFSLSLVAVIFPCLLPLLYIPTTIFFTVSSFVFQLLAAKGSPP